MAWTSLWRMSLGERLDDKFSGLGRRWGWVKDKARGLLGGGVRWENLSKMFSKRFGFTAGGADPRPTLGLIAGGEFVRDLSPLQLSRGSGSGSCEDWDCGESWWPICCVPFGAELLILRLDDWVWFRPLGSGSGAGALCAFSFRVWLACMGE